jgi:hypothetical protein
MDNIKNKILQDAMNEACTLIKKKIFENREELALGVFSRAANVDCTDFKLQVDSKIHVEVCGACFDFELHYPQVN